MKNENNINIKRFKRQNKNKQTNAKIYQERGTQEGNRVCDGIAFARLQWDCIARFAIVFVLHFDSALKRMFIIDAI